jgi:hypothetical protein
MLTVGAAHGAETPEAIDRDLAAIVLGNDPTSIAAELEARVALDQRLRRGAHSGDDKVLDGIGRVDAANTARLQELVAEGGWIGIGTYGKDAAYDAWLLVQHADAVPEFQMRVLALMEPMAASGDVIPKNYAYLWDRVAVAQDRPQRFGSQGYCQLDKPSLDWTPRPIEDAETVDARRADVGLMPMSDYVAMFDCSGESAKAAEAYQDKDYAACAVAYASYAASKKGPAREMALYNGMCCLALKADLDGAFGVLEAMLGEGFRDEAALAKDADLVSMRADPRWSKHLAAP